MGVGVFGCGWVCLGVGVCIWVWVCVFGCGCGCLGVGAYLRVRCGVVRPFYALKSRSVKGRKAFT